MVVSAPSGYGKTRAVADWAESSRRFVAWVNLGPLDGDPGRLAQSIVQSLLSAECDRAEEPPALVMDPDVEDPNAAYQAIAAALSRTGREVLLIVDDAQRAGEDWQDGLLGALAEQPPDGLRVVLVGTTLIEVTLSRHALTHPEAFVGADLLAFTEEEIGSLAGRLQADSDPGRILHETNGWPIAVRLMLIGGHAIEHGRVREVQLLREYVRDQVLRSLRPDLAEFIIASTVCADLTPELAGAVTRREDAAALLEECVRLGLFLDRYDTARGPIYRWHSVFARQCVAVGHISDPARTEELHRRAARHLVESDPLAAMRHSLLAGDPAAARELLFSRWLGLIVGPNAAAVDVACVEVARELGEDPRLVLIRACALDVTGQHRVARDLFARAKAAISRADMHGSSEPTLQLARLFLEDDRSAAAMASESVLTMLASDDRTLLDDRAAVNYVLGWAEIRHRMNASLPAEHFTAAAREAQARGDGALARRSLGHLAFALTWAGELGGARRALCELDAEGSDIAPWSYYAGGSAIAASGYLAYWEGDMRQASKDFGHVIEAGGSRISFAGVSRMMLAYAAAESGDLSACRRAAIGLQGLPLAEAHGVSWPAFRESAIAMLEEVGGNRSRAVAIARKYLGVPDLPVVCVAMAGILRRCGDSAAALGVLRSLRAFADVSYVKVALLNTAAVLRRDAGHIDRAHELCEAALEIASRENIRLPYLEREAQVRFLLREHIPHGTRFEDFAASCLADETPTAGMMTLTERELAVYRQFRTSRTLPEIAAELGLSVNTVKTHQRAIYRKLGVKSRREAVRFGL